LVGAGERIEARIFRETGGAAKYTIPMVKWEFPSLTGDYYDEIRALEAETDAPVKNQHVVSRVVLQGFAAPGKKGGGWELSPFDVSRGRELKRLGIRGCGKIANFLPYASASAEKLWQTVENDLSEAITSTRNGGLSSSSPHLQVIKDGIALHLVRSRHYLGIHQNSAQESASDVYQEAPYRYEELLQREFRRVHGIYAPGPDVLRTLLGNAFDNWNDLQSSGKLARASMGLMFERIRSGLRKLDLEIWHVPSGSELLISDSPAFTFRYNKLGRISTGCALGDAHGVAMPLAKDCLVAIGPAHKEDTFSEDHVVLFNRLQISRAIHFVWYRPGSGLGTFTAEAVRAIRPQ